MSSIPAKGPVGVRHVILSTGAATGMQECGDKDIKFAEAFQRVTPTVIKGF